MNLEEFVTATITGIVKGVEAAQEELRGRATVNPYMLGGSDQAYTSDFSTSSPSSQVEKVAFDVAVTADEGGKKGSAGLTVAGFGLKAGVDIPPEAQTTSRIQFSVNVVLPSSETPASTVDRPQRSR